MAEESRYRTSNLKLQDDQVDLDEIAPEPIGIFISEVVIEL